MPQGGQAFVQSFPEILGQLGVIAIEFTRKFWGKGKVVEHSLHERRLLRIHDCILLC
jgi:hypothetical protein